MARKYRNSSRQTRQRRGDYRHKQRRAPVDTTNLQALANVQPIVNDDTSGEDAVEYLPALFSYYPSLIGQIPWTSLRSVDAPSTPLLLKRSQHLFGQNYVFWKEEREDSDFLPDNIARKSEFIFGRLLDSSSLPKRIIFSDYADGSFGLNAVQLAKALGVKAELILIRSTLSAVNLSRITRYKNEGLKISFLDRYSQLDWALKRKRFFGKFLGSSFIDFGGRSQDAIYAYISAILELSSFEIPEFDVIFVPVDTGVTFIGMEIGRRLAGLSNTKIIGVSTRRQAEALKTDLAEMGSSKLEFLSKLLGKNLGSIKSGDLEILNPPKENRTEQLRWAGRFLELEPKNIDLLRTAPALLRASQFIRQNRWEAKKILFWNTYSGVPVNEMNLDLQKIKWPSSSMKKWDKTPELEALLA